MPLTMYDSDDPDFIPDGVFAAGYCDGYAASAWNARGWPRFPGAKRIAVWATTDDGDVLDVEQFDASPADAPGWVKRAHARGVAVPWIYCNRSNRTACERALIAAGILTDQVALWVATLDGTRTVPPGPYPVAAVQYANSALAGGHYDLSIVNDQYGPGAAQPGRRRRMFTVLDSSGTEYLFTGGALIVITDPADTAALSGAGVPLAKLTDAMIARLKAVSLDPDGGGSARKISLSGTID